MNVLKTIFVDGSHRRARALWRLIIQIIAFLALLIPLGVGVILIGSAVIRVRSARSSWAFFTAEKNLNIPQQPEKPAVREGNRSIKGAGSRRPQWKSRSTSQRRRSRHVQL